MLSPVDGRLPWRFRDQGVRNQMRKLLSLLALGAVLGLAACDNAETARVESTRAKLIGTWLQESDSGGRKYRRVLVLGQDGNFTDQVAIVTAAAKEQVEFGGEWSYDGSNLKRRFLRENGRQYSGGGMRFATFPLISVSESELVLDDNIRNEKATYRRVAERAKP